MPRYRMTVRFNAFKVTSNDMEETGSVQDEKRVITREELYRLV